MKKLIEILFTSMLSFVGAVLMYIMSRQQTLWQAWTNKWRVKYLFLSSLSLVIYFLYSHYSFYGEYRLLSWQLIHIGHFGPCLGCQALLSGLGNILLMLAMATLMNRAYAGLWLPQSKSLNTDLYICLVSTGLLQLCYSGLHFFIYRHRHLFINEHLLLPQNSKELPCSPKTVLYEVSMLPLDAVQEDLQQQLALLEVDIDEIAYIYSFNKIRYLVKTDSTVIPLIELLIASWAFLLPKSQFLAVRRDLIIAKTTVKEEYVIPGSRLGLILDPVFAKGEITLSRVATREYKEWKLNNEHKE